MGHIIVFDDLAVEGITDPLYDRNRVELLIDQAEQAFESITGRIFRKLDDQVQYANGRSSELLLLRHPAITLDSVEVNDEEVDPMTYEIVTDLVGEDHLLHPRLLLTDGSLWPKGERNVKLTGSFGFVILEGTVYVAPPLVKRAIMLIVAKRLTKIVEKVGMESAGRITSQSLGSAGGTKYSYTLGSEVRRSGFFDDPEIDEIVAAYKRIGIAAV